jgi:hypothetical protein
MMTAYPLQPPEPSVIIKDCLIALEYAHSCWPENLKVVPIPEGMAVRRIPSLTGGTDTIRLIWEGTL